MNSYKVHVALFLAWVAAVTAVVPEFHIPKPYAFGYKIKDKHGEQHRQEIGDGLHKVKGSYGFKDERGIERQVNYVADKGGFRAEIKTNEPGTAPLNPAGVKMESSAHPYFGTSKGPATAGAAKGLSAKDFAFPGYLQLEAEEAEKSELASEAALAKEKELEREPLVAGLTNEGLVFGFENSLKKLAEGGFSFLPKAPEATKKETEAAKGLEELFSKGFLLAPAIDIKAMKGAELEKEGLALEKMLQAEQLTKLGLIYPPLYANKNTALGLEEAGLMQEGLNFEKYSEAFPFVPEYMSATLPVSAPFMSKPKGFIYGGQYLGGIAKGYDARFWN